MKNKRGQFYLLAAIVIIVLIVSFVAISNYTKKKARVKIYDIKDELQIEGGEVLEYGIYPGNEPKIEDFIEKYEEYAGGDKELYFIYGNKEEIKLTTYGEERGRISINLGEVETSVVVEGKITKTYPTGGEDNIIVTINEMEYPFELKEGENFFFVISQEVEGEQHIVSG